MCQLHDFCVTIVIHVLFLSIYLSTHHRFAAGISKGFVVANFLVKGLVLIHPTVTPDGHGARSVNRYIVYLDQCSSQHT